MKPLRIIPLLLLFLLLDLNTGHAQGKSPLEVVQLFDKCYGSPHMDKITDYTTPNFRDNKPKSVWVVDAWKTLQEIQYEGVHSSVIESKVKGDKAIVIVEANIETAAREVTQKEIYYLVREGERWLIDELVVTDEEIDPEKLRL
jgi:hypothetical protein